MSETEIAPQVMFDYLNGANIPWEWPEYQPVPQY